MSSHCEHRRVPNGHDQRGKDINRQIEQNTGDGWEYLTDPPGWVVDAAKNQGLHKQAGFGVYDTFHGDTYVYKAEATAHNVGVNVYRKLKFDYFDTTRNEGTCPNCQAYVRRQDGDRFLTCHRCGWTVGYPLLRWVRYPSWIDYYFRD
jgi:hypothetical protein